MVKTMGERLGKALLRFGISHAKASTITGMQQTTISKLVREKVTSHKSSVLFAEMLGISHDWLLHGRGGMLNPTPNYIPVINDYFKLKLFLSKGFLEDNTPFIFTEQNYGESVFVTAMNEKELVICSPFDAEKITDELLTWTGLRKSIYPYKEEEDQEVFLVHEKRHYSTFPATIFSSELAQRLVPSPVPFSVKDTSKSTGRRPKMTQEQIEAAKKQRESGVPLKEIAKKFNVSTETIRRRT